MPPTVRLLCTFWLASLSACAPVILGRTPTPAAPGVTETSLSLGYPFGLTELPVCDFCEYVGPAYWPLPLPITLHVAYGRTEALETNVGLMLLPVYSPSVGVRYGAKERFQEEPIALAFDYGGSLYLTNIAADLGVLGSVPFEDAELYGALRGFGSLSWAGQPTAAAALTFGGAVPVSEGSRVLLELTLLAHSYNGAGEQEGVRPVGLSLVPAIGFEF